MQLTDKSSIKALRVAIYAHLKIQNYSRSYRSQKLRKVCPIANGLDLRRKNDVVYLARQLRLIPSDLCQAPLITEPQRQMVGREMDRISRIDFSKFFVGRTRAIA